MISRRLHTAITLLACISLSAALAALAACDNDSARLKGHFIGTAGERVYLESVAPVGTENTEHERSADSGAVTIDSTTTNGNGEFRFRVALPGGQPAFFNLRQGDDTVPLIVSPRERVSVMSFGSPEHGYRVSGSRESELVWRLHTILTDGAASLDSISRLLVLSAPDPERRMELTRGYWSERNRIKRAQIRFIDENSSSLAAVYALGARLPGDNVLFSGANDHVYYRMVADSVGRYYPDSPYVIALKKSLEL